MQASESYQAQIAELQAEVARLRNELEFLRTHTTIAQGIRGETLIAQAIGGTVTSYAEGYDVTTPDGVRIEIKCSKLNHPTKTSPTKRWNWSKPLGTMDRGKIYDYLVLIGEKDIRYERGVLDESPYVYFLIPVQEVASQMDKGRTVGGMIQLTSNLEKLRRRSAPPELLRYQRSIDAIVQLLKNASIA